LAKEQKGQERKGQGVNWPESELARVLFADSLLGANGPGSEKAMNLMESLLELVRVNSA